MDLRSNQGLEAGESDVALRAFQTRHWQPERSWGRVAMGVGAVAVLAGLVWFGLNPDPRPVAAVGPDPSVETEPARELQSGPPPGQYAPPRAAHQPAGVVGIYECVQGGQKVLSDRPCGPDAVERVVDTRQLNTFTEVAPPAVTVRHPPRASSSDVGSGPVIPDDSAESAKALRCKLLLARIDFINAQTRRKHSHREGEYWRAEWHKAKNAYYDAKCGR